MNNSIKVLVDTLIAEEWDFTLTQDSGEITLSLPLSDNNLVLHNDGNWELE